MRFATAAALVCATLVCAALGREATGATVAATYEFQNTFAANQPARDPIMPVDPDGLSAFRSDTVFGATRAVWAFTAASTATEDQSGLSLDTRLILSPRTYSIEMVFQFTHNPNDWRRVIDVASRQSDDGLYVTPDRDLRIYPAAEHSSAAWTNNEYHHLALTVESGVQAKVYLDGALTLTSNTTVMQIDNASNPGRYVNFFLDNTAEYSNGRVGLVRAWNGVLTAGEVQGLAADPFVPEPSCLGLPGAGSALLLRRRTRRAGRAAAAAAAAATSAD